LEPGKPLSYLDQNIRVGNSLLGVTPALLANGLPDEAFTPIEGDDRKVVSALKKQNAAERLGQHDLFSQSGIPVTNTVLAKRADTIAHTLPDSLEDLHVHQQRQAEQLAASAERRIQKLLADAWCAAFVQPKTDVTRSTAITHQVIENFASDESSLNLAAAEQQVADLTRQYRFFHWHVEFPHIFRVGGGSPEGWTGGFSCVIGNPPWEKVKLLEQEFFAQRDPEIAKAPNAAARKNLIAALADTAPTLYREFENESRKASGWSFFLRGSGRYPLTGRGDINTYAVFAETVRAMIAPNGRGGVIVPTVIATDTTTAPFFRDLIQQQRLDSLLDFVTNPEFWQEIGHGRMRFSLLTVVGRSTMVMQPEFATLTKHPSKLSPRGQRIHVPASDLLLVNPNTGTCPMFQTQRDADITVGIYKRVPVLWRDDPEENPWTLSFLRMFDMTNDASLFRTSSKGDMLPLYEAKLIHHFDHRLASYDKRAAESQDSELPRLDDAEKNDPQRLPTPRYWISRSEVDDRLARREWDKNWLFGWRDITKETNERTIVSSVIPRTAVGNTIFLIISPSDRISCLCANFAAFALDFVVRQKIAGLHLTYGYVTQLPIFPPNAYDDDSLRSFIESRVLELTYTAWDIAPFARDLGDEGPPFRWDEDRRFLLRAELDAAFFHLYGIARDDVDYIMETFPIVKRKDIAAHGTYRTKDKILEIYDEMTKAKSTATPYESLLTPPPGQGPRHRAR
jgi:hypothetical protein